MLFEVLNLDNRGSLSNRAVQLFGIGPGSFLNEVIQLTLQLPSSHMCGQAIFRSRPCMHVCARACHVVNCLACFDNLLLIWFFLQAGTAYIRRKIKRGQAYTELFVDELNEFYEGFPVFDASRNEDFTLRLKLYCTVCDFPGRHNRTMCGFHSPYRSLCRLVRNARLWQAYQQPCLLSLLVHREMASWFESHGQRTSCQQNAQQC